MDFDYPRTHAEVGRIRDLFGALKALYALVARFTHLEAENEALRNRLAELGETWVRERTAPRPARSNGHAAAGADLEAAARALDERASRLAEAERRLDQEQKDWRARLAEIEEAKAMMQREIALLAESHRVPGAKPVTPAS